MAVALTNYFQEQRTVYEQVAMHVLACLPHVYVPDGCSCSYHAQIKNIQLGIAASKSSTSSSDLSQVIMAHFAHPGL